MRAGEQHPDNEYRDYEANHSRLSFCSVSLMASQLAKGLAVRISRTEAGRSRHHVATNDMMTATAASGPRGDQNQRLFLGGVEPSISYRS